MRTSVVIPGIHCNACETLIRDISSDFPAIGRLTIDLKQKRVEVDHDQNFNFTDWSTALAELGPKYKPQLLS